MKTKNLLIGIGVIFGAWWIYSNRKVLAEVVTKKLNPASRENIVYQATGEVGTKVPDWWGGLFKSEAEKAVDKMLATPISPTGTGPEGQGTVTRSIANSWEIIH